APYLEEYRPLIGRNGVGRNDAGGIPGFPAHLTFGRYCAANDDSLPELEAYLADLARLATRLGRRPVYGFVRTDMRVGLVPRQDARYAYLHPPRAAPAVYVDVAPGSAG